MHSKGLSYEDYDVGVIFGGDFRTVGVGGVQTAVESFLDDYEQRGRVLLVCLAKRDDMSRPIDVLTLRKVKLVPVTVGVVLQLFIHRKKIARSCRRLVIHRSEYGIAFFGSKALSRTVLVIHGTGRHFREHASSLVGAIHLLAERLVVGRVQRTVLVSEHAREDYSCWTRSLVVVPNPVDRLPAVHTMHMLASGYRIVGYHGRLAPEKRVKLVVEAFRGLGDSEHLRLEIIGDGVERKAITEMVAGSTNISVMSWMARDAVLERVKQWAVGVYPSEFEGCPFSVLECLAAGVPVVATDVGDVSAMLQGTRGGVLVPKDVDVPRLSTAIASVLDVRWDREAVSGCVNQFSIAGYSERLLGCESPESLRGVIE